MRRVRDKDLKVQGIPIGVTMQRIERENFKATKIICTILPRFQCPFLLKTDKGLWPS